MLARRGASRRRRAQAVSTTTASPKKNDDWLRAHPSVLFHFTPTPASWVSQVGVWFGIMSRKVLREGNFTVVSELDAGAETDIAAYY